jgi:hypothetical protein
MSERALPSEPLQDLLLERTTAGLDPEASAELDRLTLEQPALAVAEAEAIERCVAAVLLAIDPRPAPLPDSLVARILADAPAAAPPRPRPRARPRLVRAASVGWWSAAACLGLALAGWWPRLMVSPAVPPAPAPAAAETATQARATLLTSAHALRAQWVPGAAAPTGGLRGDVVFDPVTQRGYLRFQGIAANDPRVQQYQLWIADAGRAQSEPVDGGVFNVDPAALEAAGGEVLIPFEPRLPIRSPAAFVVTLEQPGGVVVSRQEHVLALAKVQPG